jgi:hypothetical protein
MKRITILTPTIGSEQLTRCVNSVAMQIVTDDFHIRHVVVIDGWTHSQKVFEQYDLSPRILGDYNLEVYSIPDNTGKNKWNGHRIYAHYSQLIDCDYLALLDEDNDINQNHIASLLPIAKQHGYAYSLRKLYDKQGNYLGIDNFESTGKPNKFNYTLIDTSCWMLRRDHIYHLFHFDWQWLGDRIFTKHMQSIKHDLTVACSGQATVNYYVPDNTLKFYKDNLACEY